MDSDDMIWAAVIICALLAVVATICIPTYLVIQSGTERMKACIGQGMEYRHIPELDKYECVKR